MYDARLVRKINQGRAFVLVGSGPSSEIGYRSWRDLSEATVAEVKRRRCLSDEASYQKYLAEKKYPELFSQAERDLGGRAALIALLSQLLEPHERARSHTYEFLANWPFACYLTTNWDDEMSKSLQLKKVYFKTLLNSKEELALIRHDASGFILKLHSDFTDPDRVVITSGDYSNLFGAKGAPLRDKLKSIFEMFDVLIVGHSLSDPDLRLVLQTAKETASPEHPVFLIAADLTRAEEQEYLERFNIVAITYENTDGHHQQLRRTLSLLDKFILPRERRFDLKAIASSPEELEAAQAIALYRRLAFIPEGELSPVAYLGPLILRAIRSKQGGLPVEELVGTGPVSTAAKT